MNNQTKTPLPNYFPKDPATEYIVHGAGKKLYAIIEITNYYDDAVIDKVLIDKVQKFIYISLRCRSGINKSVFSDKKPLEVYTTIELPSKVDDQYMVHVTPPGGKPCSSRTHKGASKSIASDDEKETRRRSVTIPSGSPGDPFQ